MKRALTLVFIAVACTALPAISYAQAPVISSVFVNDTGCNYTVGVTTRPCEIGSGMTIVITGTNFTNLGGVATCGCNRATTLAWSPTQVTARVNFTYAGAGIAIETGGGLWSNGVPYTALAPVITRVVAGNCQYVPNQSGTQCPLSPGTTVYIYGKYFGPADGYGLVATCDCAAATVQSWDADWSTNPGPSGNLIVAVINHVVAGGSLGIRANYQWSNPVAYSDPVGSCEGQ